MLCLADKSGTQDEMKLRRPEIGLSRGIMEAALVAPNFGFQQSPEGLHVLD